MKAILSSICFTTTPQISSRIVTRPILTGRIKSTFWILQTFGYGFAPRYRDLHKKTEKLVGFENPGQYVSDFLIKPSRKIYYDLIVQEWPNILRIMASLAQKETTQATIVRKLSSYARQNQTKKALWELDNICRSIYILDFIDDVGLRKSVQKALNRGEAYHRFRRAVAYVEAAASSDANRSGAASLERLLTTDRQRHHLLQHRALVRKSMNRRLR